MSFSENGKGVAVICRWNEQFGRTETSSKGIENHWFVLTLLNSDEYREMEDYKDFYSNHCNEKVSLEVVDYHCLPGREMVAVCKTYWLKLIQRKWKKVYAQRKDIEKKRASIKELQYREQHGHWSNNVKSMPLLRGMLSTLS